jgi:hypothetical protein
MIKRVSSALAVTLGLILLATVPAWAQLSIHRLPHVVATMLTVTTTSTLTGNVTTGADVTVGDDLTVADDLAAADHIATQATAQTITAGGTITPTGMYHQITAAAARGTSSISGKSAGRLLVLINVGSNTITLTDTGTLKLSANAALGQYDSISLISDGTNWIELAKANN